MNKLSYLQVYKDAGLYREWILENFNSLYNSKGLRIYKHFAALAKLIKSTSEIVEKELTKEYLSA